MSSSVRLWADEELPPAPRAVVMSCVAVGLLGALVLDVNLFGLGLALTFVAGLAVAGWARGRRPTGWELVFAVLALALVAVTSLRAAEWLDLLCLTAAVGVGSLSLVAARSWTGVAMGGVLLAFVPWRAGRWVTPTLVALRPVHVTRYVAVGGVSALLLLVFGTLFSAADPAYAAVVDDALPTQSIPTVLGRTVLLGIVSVLALAAAYLGRATSEVDSFAPARGRELRRIDWAVPLAVLDLLFVSFVAVQVAVLFGGRDHVLGTHGLTYAAYARQGFWELLVVTALTLGVIAVAVRYAVRGVLLRVLLGVLCVLSLVVVASAVHRMSVYEQEYGFTRLRLFVGTVELFLGAVFVLLLLAGIRFAGTWLPRSVVLLAGVALLSLAVLNPDAWIARHNLSRYAATGSIDAAYLRELSADAVPELVRADPQLCLLTRLHLTKEPWYRSNLGVTRALRTLHDHPPAGSCLSPRSLLPD